LRSAIGALLFFLHPPVDVVVVVEEEEFVRQKEKRGPPLLPLPLAKRGLHERAGRASFLCGKGQDAHREECVGRRERMERLLT